MNLLFAMVLSAVTWAQSVNFSGSRVLNPQQSQSMDPIFELQGTSWAIRKAASGLDNQATITQTGDRVTVQFKNLTGTHDQILIFDGKPHQTVNPAGMSTTITASWQGAVLVARESVKVDGQKATLTERRSLSSDGKTMTVQVKLVASDGREASTKRGYSRK